MIQINWNCPVKWSRRLPINWNCLEDCFHRLSSNWNRLNNWFRAMYTNCNCWDDCVRKRSNSRDCPDIEFRELLLFEIWQLLLYQVQNNWFGQYTTIPRFYFLWNRMGKVPVHPIICEVLLYYAVLRVASSQWGCLIVYNINSYKAMSFREQLISWAASDYSNWFPTAEIICLDTAI